MKKPEISFKDRLSLDEVMVGDGATGTYLYSMGFSFDESFDELNILPSS